MKEPYLTTFIDYALTWTQSAPKGVSGYFDDKINTFG